jgi:hypothetical protein
MKPALRILAIAVPAVVLLLLFFALIISVAWFFTIRLTESRFTKSQTLLSDTDHQAVLAACREMMIRRKRGEPTGEVEPTDPIVPQLLRALHPARIIVGDDFVQLEMHGGFDHYGFYAYSEGSQEEGRDGGKQLIKGLWFYTESKEMR